MTAGTTDTIRTVESLVLIAIGGFAGANLRYLVGDVVGGASGTLLVNLIGSFALGFLLYEARFSGIISKRSRIVVGTGFLSSFTTYSAFALETVGFGIVGAGYVATSYTLGFAGVLAGRWLALLVDGSDRI